MISFRHLLFLALTYLFVNTLYAQAPPSLPRFLTPAEQELLDRGAYLPPAPRGITTPPPFPVRAMAEWEELQAITLTWRGYPSVLREIVRHAKEEVEVVIFCENCPSVVSYLAAYGIDTANVTLLDVPSNTVWIRDYGANPVYANDVDSLVLVDWIYNRPRPKDDVIPDHVGAYFGVPVYETAEAPYDLVNTGGNFMSDGLGKGFSSKLVLEENGPFNVFGQSNHTEEGVDSIMQRFMGIDPYIKMETLPYDGIHHIDMHMKLLDEERLLVGQFPEGVSDGPQIEANIQYVLDHFQTAFGNPFEVIRIVQPPCANGNYPPYCSWGAEYRTYTNAMFINGTILVPIYGTALDQEALAVWQQAMPGYEIHGIDCTEIIKAGGAIHCIVKEVGVYDPLWIVHERVKEAWKGQPIPITATIKHRTGIASARVWYKTEWQAAYSYTSMSASGNDEWTASVLPTTPGDTLYYYIEATANSGKTLTRPIPAPAAYLSVPLQENTTGTSKPASAEGLLDVWPNPARALTVVPVRLSRPAHGKLELVDAYGRRVHTLHEGAFAEGEQRFYFDASDLPSGTWFVRLSLEDSVYTRKMIVY